MNKPLRVLIVEDSEDDALLILRELRLGGLDPAYERVENRQTLAAALGREAWDIIISDHRLPGFDSFAALGVLKDLGLDIPFILVSGAIGEETAVAVMKAGACDYVAKDRLTRLVPSIERELREAWGRQARRRTEEILRRSQRELNDFFENATVGLHWVGPDGTILRVNQAELDILGYAREEYLGHRIDEFYGDPEVAENMLSHLRRGEAQDNCEVGFRSRDGTPRTVLITSNAVWEDGELMRMNCFMRDITDRKRGEEALVHLAAIVEFSEDAIIGKTLEGTILSWNVAAERMYGYTSPEILGRSMGLLILPERSEELKQISERIRLGERVSRFETVRQRKDGQHIDVAVTLSAIKDRSGVVIGVSAIERDITLRKREEEERIKLIQELREAVGKIKTLRGLLPICASCKKIRDDHGYWQKVESYISAHSEAEFTHGICPDCMGSLYPEFVSKMKT